MERTVVHALPHPLRFVDTMRFRASLIRFSVGAGHRTESNLLNQLRGFIYVRTGDAGLRFSNSCCRAQPHCTYDLSTSICIETDRISCTGEK
jgi:hypothetical protein